MYQRAITENLMSADDVIVVGTVIDLTCVCDSSLGPSRLEWMHYTTR